MTHNKDKEEFYIDLDIGNSRFYKGIKLTDSEKEYLLITKFTEKNVLQVLDDITKCNLDNLVNCKFTPAKDAILMDTTIKLNFYPFKLKSDVSQTTLLEKGFSISKQ